MPMHHDDRIDGMAGVVGAFAWLACGASYADVLGVDPQMMATRASEERLEADLEKLFGPDDGDDENGMPIMGRSDRRAAGLKPTAR